VNTDPPPEEELTIRQSQPGDFETEMGHVSNVEAGEARVPQRIGPLEMKGKLGQGGMGIAASGNIHPGQVSLPGGSEESIDSGVVATALRESEEEIGLAQSNVEVIGRLGDMALPSGFQITPIVGLIEPDLEFVPCPIEVAEIFHAPLSLLMNPDSYNATSMTYDNQARKILELQFKRFRIWGATAAILYHLAQMIENSKK